MPDKVPSPGGFPAAAAGGLAPVAGDVKQIKHKAEIGGLRLDADTANALLREIAAVRRRARELVTDSADLDRPLKFGDNWVGEQMSERLRTVAADHRGGVSPVLSAFARVLADLEYTIRAAAGLYYTTDEQSAAELKRSVERLGLRLES
jgi:hypothetical protein